MAYLTTDDTIAAIASPAGIGRRGIIRLSGPCVGAIIAGTFVSDEPVAIKNVKRPARMEGNVRLAGSLLPATLLYWPDHRSYTRQPSAELHTFGSAPLLEMAIKHLCDCGARLAQPGEFTLRAFLSGRMDLTQAEAVLAVIDAESKKKLSVALNQLSGGLAGPLAETKQTLMNVLAELEAGLDFVEEDIEFIASDQIISALREGLNQVQTIQRQIQQRGSDSQDFKVTLSGLPNAGKSSLFNALLESDQAIVTDLAGTTTDIVTATTEFEGIAIQLIDTAGVEPVREQSETAADDDIADRRIMRTAQQKRLHEIDNAELVLLCVGPDPQSHNWASKQLESLERNGQVFLLVLTKSDLLGKHDANQQLCSVERLQNQITDLTGARRKLITVSSHTGENLDRLKFEISATAVAASTSENAVVGSTLLRTRESLRLVAGSIASALEAAEGDIGQEIVAAEIRQALDALGQIVGTVYNDDILDLVFGRFCIGK